MLINNKPRAYICMYPLTHSGWSDSNNLPQLLSEFDIGQETWMEFDSLIDIAAETGFNYSKIEKYNKFAGDETVTEILKDFRTSSEYKRALEVSSEHSFDDKRHIDALCELAEESLVNSFYFALKGKKSK